MKFYHTFYLKISIVFRASAILSCIFPLRWHRSCAACSIVYVNEQKLKREEMRAHEADE